MKLEEVPQDNVSHFHGEKKALYAQNKTGEYVVTASSGWDAEAVVLQQAIDDLEELRDLARAAALRGEKSPLEYFMYAHRMDLPTLAMSTGFFQWQVRRHFRFDVFLKLSPKILRRYADAFDRSPECLIAWQQGNPCE